LSQWHLSPKIIECIRRRIRNSNEPKEICAKTAERERREIDLGLARRIVWTLCLLKNYS